MIVEQLLRGVALPALVAVAVLLAARQLSRWLRRDPGAWAGGLAMGAAYVAGHLALFGWAGLKASEGWQQMPLIAVAVATASMLLLWARIPRLVGWAVAVLVAVAAAWLLVPHWHESQVAWTVALASAATMVWIASFTLAKHTPAASPPLVMLIAAAFAVLILERSASARFAQLAGVLAASSSGCLVAALLGSAPKMGPGMVGGGAVLLVGLMFTGHFNHFSDVPPLCFFLVAGAPMLAWVGRLGPVRRRRPWQRLTSEALAVLVPAAVALALAFAA